MSNTAEIINFPNKTEQPGGRMVDLSNGYTKVANEIQQLKPRLRLSGREWQCFEAVIWLTYGWNKKQDRVTNTVIAELTGLSDTHVSDALKSLAERKIIFSQKQGMMKIVGVNTDLSAWILDKPETGRKFPKTGKSFPKSGITFPKTVDTQYKNKNKNSIKRSSSENSDESSDARLKKFLSTHPEAAVYTPSGAKWGSAEDLETAKWISSRVKLINPGLNNAKLAGLIGMDTKKISGTVSTLLADGLIRCEGKYGQRLYSLTSYGMRFAPDTILGMKQGKSKLIQRTDTNVICQECRNSAAMRRVLMVWGRVGV